MTSRLTKFRHLSLSITVCHMALLLTFCSLASESLGKTDGYLREGRSLVFLGDRRERLQITPYGNFIVRVQAVRHREDVFSDDHYGMIESHQWPGELSVVEDSASFRITAQSDSGIVVRLKNNPMKISTYKSPILSCNSDRTYMIH